MSYFGLLHGVNARDLVGKVQEIGGSDQLERQLDLGDGCDDDSQPGFDGDSHRPDSD